MLSNINNILSSGIIDLRINSTKPKYRSRYSNDFIFLNNRLVKFEVGQEIPLYSYPESREGSRVYTTNFSDPLPFYIDASIRFKSLGKSFYQIFDNYINKMFIKFTLKDKTYYVHRGIILDAQLNPLVLATYKLSEVDLEIEDNSFKVKVFDTNKMTFYINKCVFTEEFRNNNKAMHTGLVNTIIPGLLAMRVKTVFKTNLNIWSEVRPNPNTSIKDFKTSVISNLDECKAEFIRSL